MSQEPLLDQLNSFDKTTRMRALMDLREDMTRRDRLRPPHVNMHCHTFFSYNGYGASPCRVAWQSVTMGLTAAAITDFDVLDGMNEFLWATDTLGLRAAVHMETRSFFQEYADQQINSPGEPGVYYFMGGGFVRPPAPGSSALKQLDAMRRGAEARNRDLISRVNAYLSTVQLAYDEEVLPLTPRCNATERHICSAYYDKAAEIYPDEAKRVAYWAEILKVDAAKIAKDIANPMAFSDLLRSKLMKAGGPGYVKPDKDTFPALDDVVNMILDCGAIPMATWLDGTTDGESDMATQLECLQAKGIAAINIIPDRNWNIDDTTQRNLKVRKFHECVAIADRMNLPINVGTELNKYGQRWVDDFQAEAMAPVAHSFIRGAFIMVGHSRMLRYANLSYASAATDAEFGGDVDSKNAFFASLGSLSVPNEKVREQLESATPDANYTRLRDAVANGHW